VRELGEEIELDKNKKHAIEVVVDRLVVKDTIAARLADSLETALRLAEGVVVVEAQDGGQAFVFSERLACARCGVSFPEISPRMFSFNNPYGACPECGGLGTRVELDPDLVVPDPGKPLSRGALAPWVGRESVYFKQTLQVLARRRKFSLDTPWRELPKATRELILRGAGAEGRDERRAGGEARPGRDDLGGFEGVLAILDRRYKETTSEETRQELERFMSERPCPACRGGRLRPESLAVRVGGRSIQEVGALTIKQAADFFDALALGEREQAIARRVLKEIRERLGFLRDVGLDYLTLDRASATLAGGEGQRIRLATQIGSSLVGVLYILDEPSIGLHQRDNRRLLDTLLRLRDLGNTVLVVEHDEETIRAADHVIDLGPGAGELGGYVVSTGTPAEIMADAKSLTGRYLDGDLSIPLPRARRPGSGKWLTVHNPREHNLKGMAVRIPLGTFTCVTGVSGSGKSTLVNDILYRALAQVFHRAQDRPGAHDRIEGLQHLDKVINIDQSPIGRTPRSNPATYTGVFAFIRALFARTQDARARGYAPGRFSFNVKGGRCEACQGDGLVKIEMHFLPDVYVTCEVCKGKRYNRETLEIRYKSRNVAEVLEMTVREALAFFEAVPPIKQKLQTLHDVGLDYIRLGQPATTLSGGEAQRVKLSSELSRRATGRTLYILDEPTTGLHFADIQRLLDVLNQLVEQGNTVVVIEHNLDVVKTADHLIDLGPEGGDEGGRVVAAGPPEAVVREAERSHTGRFLQRVLAAHA
jgi:excinuclease ABC subunit A